MDALRNSAEFSFFLFSDACVLKQILKMVTRIRSILKLHLVHSDIFARVMTLYYLLFPCFWSLSAYQLSAFQHNLELVQNVTDRPPVKTKTAHSSPTDFENGRL